MHAAMHRYSEALDWRNSPPGVYRLFTAVIAAAVADPVLSHAKRELLSPPEALITPGIQCTTPAVEVGNNPKVFMALNRTR
jgi:hypothetical protein